MSAANGATANGSGLAVVVGGSGFVGRHVVRALAQRGWRVRAAERRPDLAGFLQPMGVVGQVMPVQANLRFPDSVASAVQGAELVVNCVAIGMKSGRQTFQSVNVDGARAVARAARQAGVGRLVHISALGADKASAANYARSKAAGEQAVLEEFPDAVILRPSIVFGPEDQFFNRFAGMARVAPLMPLVGGGKTKFQPVYVGDVASAVMAAGVDGKARAGTVYELGGPEVATFRQLLDNTQTWAGRDRGYLYMPFWLTKLQAMLTAPLPNAMRPITVDQVRMLQKPNVVSEAAIKEGRTLAGLGIGAPHAAGAIVPAYLERFKAKGQYAHYRG